MLATFDRDGKPLQTRVLSHGAQLEIEDAAQNPKGELYLMGNRWDLNMYGFPATADGAELIKCDSRGEFIWARNVKLPGGCFVKGITYGGDGAIYIFGDSHGYAPQQPPPPRRAPGKPARPTRFFIYRLSLDENTP